MMILILSLAILNGATQLVCDKTHTFADGNKQLADHTQFNKSTAFQRGSYIDFTDQNLNEIMVPALNPVQNSLYCQRVFSHPNGQYILSICLLYGQIPYIQAFKCNDKECTKFGEMQELLRSQQGFSKLEIIQDTLIVLCADRYYPFANVDYGRIDFYKLTFTDTEFKIQMTNYIIDSYFFDSYQNPIYMSDFRVEYQIVADEPIYKMIITDRANGLLWINCQLRNNQLIPMAKGRIDIKPYVYATSSTQFLQVYFNTPSIIVGQSVRSELLVTTNNIDHYILDIQFDGINYQSVYVKQSLNKLFDWKGENQSVKYQNWFAIAQWHTTGQAISLYKLNNNSNNLQLDILKTIYLTGYQGYYVFFFDLVDKQLVFNYRSALNIMTQCKII